jgi:type IV pilus assembly protein PilW
MNHAIKNRDSGFGLVELMIAVGLGLIVVAGALVVFLSQRQVYQAASSQALIQDADNAISAVITPVIRGAGFTGCSTIGTGIKNYATSLPTPLTFNTGSAIRGFKANAEPASLVDGAANDLTASDWTPTLDSSFITAGGVEKGSDVLVMIGATPMTVPVGVTAFNAGSITVNNAAAAGITNTPQMIALSDCGKSSAFQMTNLSGNVVNYSIGPNGTPSYPVGSQLTPIQQTAFFIAKGHAGQSALFEGVMTIPSGGTAANATWSVQELVPGVSNMQILYGVGTTGQIATTQYVAANAVTNWADVTSVKIGFLIEGSQASATASTNLQSFNIFGVTLAVPKDSRMRHTYFMTVNSRNTTL